MSTPIQLPRFLLVRRPKFRAGNALKDLPATAGGLCSIYLVFKVALKAERKASHQDGGAHEQRDCQAQHDQPASGPLW